jgi:hypothetical protein
LPIYANNGYKKWQVSYKLEGDNFCGNGDNLSGIQRQFMWRHGQFMWHSTGVVLVIIVARDQVVIIYTY